MPKVIIVDDDQYLLEGFELSLRKAPFDLLLLSSAEAAIKILESTVIDVVVSDLILPGLDGIKLLEYCTAFKPEVSCIILSGQITTKATLHAINNLNVFKILEKPCAPSTLQSTIKEAIIENELLQGKQELINVAIEAILNEAARENSSFKACPIEKIQRKNLDLLSPREIEVLKNFALGFRIAKISEQLCISKHTVRNHFKSIFSKLQVHSQQELLELLSR